MEGVKTRIIDQIQRTYRVLVRLPFVDEFLEDLQTLFRLANSYRLNQYRDISMITFAVIAFGLIYFVSPLDIVPDFIFAIGLIDDMAILGFITTRVRSEIEEYRQWEERMAEYGDKISIDQVSGNVTVME